MCLRFVLVSTCSLSTTLLGGSSCILVTCLQLWSAGWFSSYNCCYCQLAKNHDCCLSKSPHIINPDLPSHKLRSGKLTICRSVSQWGTMGFSCFFSTSSSTRLRCPQTWLGKSRKSPTNSSRLDAAFAAAATADARRDEMWRPSLGYTKNRCGISVRILAAIKTSIEFGGFLDLPASHVWGHRRVDVESGKPMVFRSETDLEIMGNMPISTTYISIWYGTCGR